MRYRLFAAVGVAVLGVIALSFDTSCKNLPDGICRGGELNRLVDENTNQPASACTECIEKNCCDHAGRCHEEVACNGQVQRAHECIVNAGARAAANEQGCLLEAGIVDESRAGATYACMRTHCATACRLPACEPKPAVPFMGDLKCDRCFSRSCCVFMNACAENRICMLTLQCIVRECAPAFGDALGIQRYDAAVHRRRCECSRPGEQPTDCRRPDGGGDVEDPEDDGRDDEGSRCFSNCVDKYQDPDRDASTQEADEARCLALLLNECGTAANCGADCTFDAGDAEAGADAGSDAPPPPDGSLDASTD